MDYLEITLQTASDGIDLVANALTSGGFDSLVVEDQAEYENFLEDNRAYWDYIDEDFQAQLQGLSRIKLYLEVDGTEQAQLKKLEKVIAYLKKRFPDRNLGSLELEQKLLPETNWEESWKDNYPPQYVGEHLIVLPYWNAQATEGRIPIILDPGLTFGTGAHPSTRMVMAFLEERLKSGARVIDLGSGSGILSIAALRLGADSAVGVDIDPKAESIARENAAYNGFGPQVFTALTGNVTEDEELMAQLSAEPYDIVLVNIVADVIIGLAPVLPRFVKPDGLVLLSGILDVREQDVVSALTAAGLEIVERKADEDWRSLCARRRNPA
ncbi:MAG: 50S ribosomal protein L11 methyltransferase [Oscillospiraceae bacterium]|nr:50S ribosomal protein L11 methyltransferase [Oscillospiraceae bacterium]